jgi:pimeloyl-ACP methyl ester carboxylesterase
VLKWTLRIGGGLLALVLVTLTILIIAHSLWISDHKRKLLEGSQVASTPLGEVEYSIVGEGEPLLSIHGTPGGYDQAQIFSHVFPEYSDVRSIAVSRPGYLRTPLTSGETPEQQADLYAALLDELQIDRVVVMGSSGGAPSAVQFAIRHPERTKALVLLVPLLANMKGDYNPRPPKLFLIEQNVVTWLLGTRLVMTPELDAKDEKQMQSARALVRTQVPAELRVEGLVNDLLQFRKLGIEAWPLEEIAAPTLILHGNADNNTPYEASVAAAGRIPGAKLETFEGGNHYIVVTRTAEILARRQAFLDSLAEQPQPAAASGPATTP